MPMRRCVFALILAALVTAGTAARSQGLPPDAALAIAAALAENRRAGAISAVTAATLYDPTGRLTLDNAVRLSNEAALSEAVITSIAKHPGSAQAIVAAAVAAAPAHGEAVIARAGAAYPGFAGLFTSSVQAIQPPSPVYVAQPQVVRTEEAGHRDPSLIDLRYLESFPLNAGRLLATPWRFDRSDWTNTAIVLGAAGGLILLDTTIRDFIQDDVRGGASNDIADFFRDFGDTKLLAAGLGVAYVGGELIDDWTLRETALLAEESLLLASVLGLGIKWVTQRDRPSSGKNASSWDPFSFDESNTSFPSGHAINSFAVASVIASEYEDYDFVAPAAYGIASLTAFSRLNDNRHWASDVFGGAALGYFMGKMVVRYNPFDPARGLKLSPWGNTDSRGLNLAVDF